MQNIPSICKGCITSKRNAAVGALIVIVVAAAGSDGDDGDGDYDDDDDDDDDDDHDDNGFHCVPRWWLGLLLVFHKQGMFVWK